MGSDEPVFWFTEREHDPGIRHYISVKESIFAGQTQFQDVNILDTHAWGKILILDGVVQSTEDDEYIFHEALVQPAMMAHTDPKRVCIVGGGEGATLHEVLKHSVVDHVVMVDIDRELVDLCRQHLPEWHENSFDNPRAEIVFEDVRDFVERNEQPFDVIVYDLVDFIESGPVADLYSVAFFRKLRDQLRSGGLLVVQGMELGQLDIAECASHLTARRALVEVFPLVQTYSTFIPSFRSEWGFLIASDGTDPAGLTRAQIEECLARATPSDEFDSLAATMDFYDADAHARMFNLPKDIKAILAQVNTQAGD